MGIDVSVIIPCYNEADNIGECLDSLLVQEYTQGRFEILVSDGGSSDGTLDILEKAKKASSLIRIEKSPERWTASVRNHAIKNTSFRYLAFIDADCVAPVWWLERLVRVFSAIKGCDPAVAAVGGPNFTPEDSPPLTEAIGIAMDSYAGSFSSVQGRRYKKPVYVKSLPTLNAIYERDEIEEIGYFDESLKDEAEDADLNFRLAKRGARFYFVPDLFVWHKMRSTPSKWLANMFRYGKGRARLLKRYPEMWEVSFCLPLLFACLMGSVLLSPVIPACLIPLFYFPAIFIYSVARAFAKKRPRLFLHVFLVYILEHFGYSAGEIYGLLNRKVR